MDKSIFIPATVLIVIGFIAIFFGMITMSKLVTAGTSKLEERTAFVVEKCDNVPLEQYETCKVRALDQWLAGELR